MSYIHRTKKQTDGHVDEVSVLHHLSDELIGLIVDIRSIDLIRSSILDIRYFMSTFEPPSLIYHLP
jgi:hypothetical protein